MSIYTDLHNTVVTYEQILGSNYLNTRGVYTNCYGGCCRLSKLRKHGLSYTAAGSDPSFKSIWLYRVASSRPGDTGTSIFGSNPIGLSSGVGERSYKRDL